MNPLTLTIVFVIVVLSSSSSLNFFIFGLESNRTIDLKNFVIEIEPISSPSTFFSNIPRVELSSSYSLCHPLSPLNDDELWWKSKICYGSHFSFNGITDYSGMLIIDGRDLRLGHDKGYHLFVTSRSAYLINIYDSISNKSLSGVHVSGDLEIYNQYRSEISSPINASIRSPINSFPDSINININLTLNGYNKVTYLFHDRWTPIVI